MGRWNYYNVGASAEPEHKKHVQKIFEYIGYAPHPARSEILMVKIFSLILKYTGVCGLI